MKATFHKFFSSYLTTVILLLIYAVALAAATFIEKYQGTPAAKALVYYSPAMFLLQFLMVVNFIVVVIKRQLFKKKMWGFLVIHVAFVIILVGALVSHIFGEEGILHIREGEASNQMVVYTSKGMETHTLPFTVELLKFTLTRYPGSSSPSSYESDLLFHVDGKTMNKQVFMNNVVDLKGYRFFQASYDKDEQGTVLSVNRDVAGRYVTYTGYFMLVIGFILSLVGKNSRFRRLNKQLKTLRISGATVIVLICGLFFSTPLEAHLDNSSLLDALQQYPVKPEHAAIFGELPIQSSRGRMMPVNTFSSEILRKIYKADKIGNMNSDQFLISLIAMPEMWKRVPFIKYSGKELAIFYDLTEDACSFWEVFDENGDYKLRDKLERAYNKLPAERTSFDKEIIKLDEKINILYQLFSYRMLNLFPLEGDPEHTWFAPGDDLSTSFTGQDSLFVAHGLDLYAERVQTGLQSGDWREADRMLEAIGNYQKEKNTTLEIDEKKLQMEIKYNKMEIFRYCKIFFLICGGLLLVLAFVSLFKSSKTITILGYILTTGVIITFIYQMAGMGMRWYIGGYAPWSNSYETMVYVAWAAVTGGLLFVRRSKITFALAVLFGGIILFVSGLNWMDPQINTLVPVLKSPWLMFHVAVIVAAYGFFGISFLIGITNMILMIVRKEKNKALFSERIKELTIVNEMSLIVGGALMTIGTFLGAVWANESWGRYWGWDPKETWALITMVIYAIVIHLRLVKSWYNHWFFNFISVLAFGSVLMTYFGVNYFLSGMHSYGQTGQAGGVMTYISIALVVIAILGFLSWKEFKKEVKEVRS